MRGDSGATRRGVRRRWRHRISRAKAQLRHSILEAWLGAKKYCGYMPIFAVLGPQDTSSNEFDHIRVFLVISYCIFDVVLRPFTYIYL